MWRSNARSPIFGLSTAAMLVLLVVLWMPAGAQAELPPNMPLPPCTIVAGVRSGACPAESEAVAGRAAGRFVFGGSVAVTTDPKDPVCNSWGKYTLEWAPSPCFARVATPVIVGCATIDLRNGERFRELPCNQALYRSTQGLSGSLFSMLRPNGATGYEGRVACGDAPDFNTFIYGGPSTIGESVWSARGGSALACEVKFTGPRRPDGLYGPTWVKMRVEIGSAHTGDNRPGGTSESAEFYVPIDGDLRYSVDVDISTTATIQTADWDNGRVFAMYRATLSNRGSETAENVHLAVQFPKSLKYQSVSDSSCVPGSTALRSRGGDVQCSGLSLPAGSHRTIEFVVRVVNATDLNSLQQGQLQGGGVRGVAFSARAENDVDTTNNDALGVLELPFRSGSYEETRIAMLALNPYFDYRTDKFAKACNSYKIDIFERLEQIRGLYPQVFANLSYGGVSSGTYKVPITGGSAGHVGVVVYVKGTNFRQTGIVINGTPTPSPLAAVSTVGPDGPVISGGLAGFTAANGLYLRTPANEFPGAPFEESAGFNTYGFEGRYVDNGAEFDEVAAEPEPEPVSCPFAPDAVTVATESPVEIIVTNSRGQRVETSDGLIVTEELDGGIHAMAFPHADGTYAWTLVLPVDRYDVQLRGTREGSYRLTLTTFAADGTPIPIVTSGTTSPGKVDPYVLEAANAVPPASPPPTTTTPTTTPTVPSIPPARGGGGGIDVLALLSMIGLLGLQLGRRPRRLPVP